MTATGPRKVLRNLSIVILTISVTNITTRLYLTYRSFGNYRSFGENNFGKDFWGPKVRVYLRKFPTDFGKNSDIFDQKFHSHQFQPKNVYQDGSCIDTVSQFLSNFRKNTTKNTTKAGNSHLIHFFLNKSYQLGHEYCNY